ncbi:MAG: acyl-[acyl-carrier-protein]--UDP-N-acetylglucosamine O-acyltransferase [Candidatus Melainabacteria bacterium]|nr:MAG: acyl-[acyl-carrier-protein]--UDP-N-acetylglucosamine O-acyltransferase [Candidatus Melainabacteria bacterium]
MSIHKTAIIGDGAKIAADAEVGPYAVIGSQVSIGSATKIGAHVVIDGQTRIGANCHIFAGASIGLEPQSISYAGEPTGVSIGDRVTVREYATIHRGTKEDGLTVIGDDCYLMNYAHVAHDCKLGKGIIMANSATLAGHVVVGDGTVMAGACVFHQFVRIGRLCMVSGLTGSRVDLPPFVVLDGRPPAIRGINIIGMRRQKLSPQARTAIKQAYKTLYKSGLNFSQAIAQLEQESEQPQEVNEIIDFFKTSKRGVLGLYSEDDSSESSNGEDGHN